MKVDEARQAFQAAEAEVSEVRDRIAELESEREDRIQEVQRLGDRRRKALAAGESPRDLRDEKRRLAAEIEDLGEEIVALGQIADERDSGCTQARHILETAKREAMERSGRKLVSELRNGLEGLGGTVERLDDLQAEHRRSDDTIRQLGGPRSGLFEFANHRDWRAFRTALDRLSL